MRPKAILKLSVDLAMAGLLVVQMSYQTTGQKAHEWAGALMIALFLAHNILNIGWYKNLFKGAYSAARVFRATVNLLVLATVIPLAISGVVMSGYVFDFLPIHVRIALARLLHMTASSWAFISISLHIGLHWSMLTAMFLKPLKRIASFPILILRIIALAIAGYGAWAFHKANMVSNMFIINQFAFLDYEKSPVAVFADNIAMMGLWICVAHYAVKPLNHRKYHKIEAITELGY
jgi:hypothetical protein